MASTCLGRQRTFSLQLSPQEQEFLQMLICGGGSLSHQDQDEKESYGSPCPTPKRSKRSTSFCKIIGKASKKNPYAQRGLDKFYALLADLDSKKQKIYTQKGAEDVSFVRFVYTNDSNHVKPIVVKVKEKQQEKNSTGWIKKSFKKNSSNLKQADMVSDDVSIVASQSTLINEKKPKKRRCLRCNGSFKLDNLRQPYFYFPVIVVLVLMSLAMYGRSFAVLCTSIGWYMFGKSSPSYNERKPKRKQSEKKINVLSDRPSSPKSVINGLTQIRYNSATIRRRRQAWPQMKID